MKIDIEKYGDLLITYAIQYGTRIIVSLLVLFIGLWLIRKITSFAFRMMEERNVDVSLRPFVRDILGIFLKIILIIIVISQLGLEVSSFIAVLGSIGLAIGLALQGSLSNFAGGVLLLIIKPFRVGDFIEAQGVSGKVNQINIFNTVIKTLDNKTIFIPNGPLANATITNYDVEPNRRADLRLIVHYDNNIERAKELIHNIISSDSRILAEPAPQVVTENTETGVAIITRVWSQRENLAAITNDLNDQIRSAFARENITIYWRQPEATFKK